MESKVKSKEKISVSGGKKFREALSKVPENKVFNLSDAISKIKECSFVKFDETLDVAVQLGVDPKHSDQMVRGVVSMPSGTGKVVKVAVICKEDKYDIAKDSGADIVGGQDILDAIKANEIKYDVYITTPDMMGMVSQVARILGPRGLMPNPKLGTVTTDIKKVVAEKKAGQVEFKVDKSGIIHAGVGKLSFSVEDLKKNVNALTDALLKLKPSASKGLYMKQIYLSSTMGPSVKVDLASL
jgi:large subunit ribosomal protein L1